MLFQKDTIPWTLCEKCHNKTDNYMGRAKKCKLKEDCGIGLKN